MPGEPVRWTEADLLDHERRYKAALSGEAVPVCKTMQTPIPNVSKGRSVAPHGRKMNKVETAYSVLMDAEQKAGHIVRWRYEDICLRLANGLRYTPDFAVTKRLLSDTTGPIEMVEVKTRWKNEKKKSGPSFRDGRDRAVLLMAAKLFPEFSWKIVWMEKGQWKEERIS